jgi:GTP cyclohydrolase I
MIKPTKDQALNAVRTLLSYIGENPDRSGLLETPDRVLRSFDEFYSGYHDDPALILGKTFEDIDQYDDFVLVKNIDFISHCEHHMVPIIGRAHVAYWPDQNVVGISKLARLVDVYAKRLISQETMTQQIGKALDTHIQPKGVAIIIDAAHQCMNTRGVFKANSSTVTSYMSGVFKNDASVMDRFLKNLI